MISSAAPVVVPWTSLVFFGILFVGALVGAAWTSFEWAKEVAMEMKARTPPAYRARHQAPLTVVKPPRLPQLSLWCRAFYDSSVAAAGTLNARRTDPQL